MKIKKSRKNRNIQRVPRTRCQKRGVPEEAKIGRTIIPLKNESTEDKFKNDLKNKAVGNSAHARCQKEGVPEEAEIHLQLIHFKKV